LPCFRFFNEFLFEQIGNKINLKAFLGRLTLYRFVQKFVCEVKWRQKMMEPKDNGTKYGGTKDSEAKR
jgi:hypothetical protein